MQNREVLADGCYPEHDATKSWCEQFKGNRSKFPRFNNVDDLITIEDMAKFLGVRRRYLADARYQDPALPYFRFGKMILLSKVQVAWWLNEIQETQIDKYFLDRRRRLANGKLPPTGKQRGRRPRRASTVEK
jgi:hypothetical protein